jgi:hypothetical protein
MLAIRPMSQALVDGRLFKRKHVNVSQEEYPQSFDFHIPLAAGGQMKHDIYGFLE